jgi:hypothetical protein
VVFLVKINALIIAPAMIICHGHKNMLLGDLMNFVASMSMDRRRRRRRRRQQQDPSQAGNRNGS